MTYTDMYKCSLVNITRAIVNNRRKILDAYGGTQTGHPIRTVMNNPGLSVRNFHRDGKSGKSLHTDLGFPYILMRATLVTPSAPDKSFTTRPSRQWSGTVFSRWRTTTSTIATDPQLRCHFWRSMSECSQSINRPYKSGAYFRIKSQ